MSVHVHMNSPSYLNRMYTTISGYSDNYRTTISRPSNQLNSRYYCQYHL